MSQEKLFFLYDSNNPKSVRAYKLLTKQYAGLLASSVKDCDFVIVLGGDGFMLRSLKKILAYRQKLHPKVREKLKFKIYGLNFGHVGALLNPYDDSDLKKKIQQAETVSLIPLRADILKADATYRHDFSFNELSIKSLTHQMCHLSVRFDMGLDTTAYTVQGDGVIVSTPAGSTSYYKHAGGTPFPINSSLLGIQSICAAESLQKLVPSSVHVVINAIHTDRRPVCAVMDNRAINNILECQVRADPSNAIPVLLNKKDKIYPSAPSSGKEYGV